MLKISLLSLVALLLSQMLYARGENIVLTRRDIPGFADITSADWIWAGSRNFGQSAGFRRVYTTPFGKRAVVANCQASGVRQLTFFYNGMGGFVQFPIINLLLNPFSNLFAIRADPPIGNIGGFIAACEIVFSDGTMDTLVTSNDGSWHTAAIAANDITFCDPEYYENSAWGPAALIGTYASMPFGPISVQPMPGSPDFSSASWIWTNEGSSVPGEARAFRYTFTPAQFQLGLVATVVVTCDNSYTFWLNGNLVALSPTETDWTTGQRYVLPLQSGPNLFAFVGFNLDAAPSPAALLVSVQVTLATGPLINFVSDSTWRTLNGQTPPFNFQLPTFNDSTWNNATVYATYGGGPWGNGVALPSLLP
ncbi:hypothetical protein B0H19DRAFT_677204 [Mycena capillaripes]|nr:hypothetical protein B0H19DRAFT_677204 [Mycena capillaripes]